MLPEGWVRETKHRLMEPRKEYRRWLPSNNYFDELGNYSETDPLKRTRWAARVAQFCQSIEPHQNFTQAAWH